MPWCGVIHRAVILNLQQTSCTNTDHLHVLLGLKQKLRTINLINLQA